MDNLILTLKADWDAPPKLIVDDKQIRYGHFIGRRREVERLTNELLRKSHGTFLITGQRGVGKTALVFEAINRLFQKDRHYIPVYLNASQLALPDDPKRKDKLSV